MQAMQHHGKKEVWNVKIRNPGSMLASGHRVRAIRNPRNDTISLDAGVSKPSFEAMNMEL
ncbi:d0a9c28a-1577-4155-87ef-b1876f685ecd-CDS [Sclerotinia trifoliorum]|uniref:D0a9c28a-1577-4155-87ef-b1876f685ecd-CDS n=1 Tax=Sclerotinia trifoliorum TaxID=28548 RepID=A0A8H2VU32_9HELO|nr:d0a9c28a-1577-4155-87ef-b1876f685ecd-CDS [Sclerotinia trifoliorum]